jgi:N-acetylglutamate synthase-like GNAT family acetyltransferase
VITFENYTKNEREECIGLFKSNQPKFFAPDELQDFTTYLDKYIEKFWCMKIDGVLIGAGGIRVRADNVGRLCWGIIHADLHRKGFGSQLLRFRLQQLALIPDLPTIQLDTSQYNPDFFKRFGFVEISKSENLYGPGLHSHEMELLLTPENRQKLIT